MVQPTGRTADAESVLPMVLKTIPIFNLSTHILSEAEISILSKGLSFVPTVRQNFLELHTELLRFFRRIRLQAFFALNPSPISGGNTPFRPPSTFSPTANMVPAEILTFEKMVLKDFEQLKQTKAFIPYNISSTEKKAIETLKGLDSLIIKSADKGGRDSPAR